MPRRKTELTDEDIQSMINRPLPSVDYDDSDMITNDKIADYWRTVMNNIVESGQYASKDELSWMSRNLHRLLNLSLSLKQLSIPVNDSLPCKRMARIKVFIPKYIYENNNVESVFLNGMYAPIEGLMCTPSQADQLLNHKYITESLLNELDLPSGYNYGVMRSAAGSVFVPKNNEFNSYITHTCKWEYFDLSQGLELLTIQYK